MFKLKTKKSFVENLNEIRVSNACNLRIEIDLGISEIAYKYGYKELRISITFFKN